MRNRASADLLPRDDCEPADPQNTVTDRLNKLLNSSGPGYTLPLCPGQTYYITAPLEFSAHDQEISTVGYPEGDDRATLVVSGAITNGVGQTTAVLGQCVDCGGIKLRHIQVRITVRRASVLPDDQQLCCRSMALAEMAVLSAVAPTSKWVAITLGNS